MRIDVAIALPGVAPFTYEVPAELADAVRPGVRVRVPFGSGQRIGVVTGSAGAGDRSLKPVLEVLDQEPVLSAELLDLTRWIAGYYRCGWGEAIRAALPPGMDARLVKTVFANASLINGGAAPSANLKMADFLREHQSASYDYIVRKFGRRAVRDLEMMHSAGLIGIYHIWQKARTGIKCEQWLAVRDGEFTSRRAPAQLRLWRLLQERRLLSPDELAGARAAARSLVALGLAAWEARTVDRLPAWPDLAQEPGVTELNDEQECARRAVAGDIDRKAFSVRMLLGVTASGKTELYLRAAKAALAAGRQVLILVPEIGLTHQMVSRVRAALGDTAVLHSEMSGGQRFDAWRLINERRYRVVVGTRSAVFAPLDNIGLIVVDEEQDQSYKQEDCRPHYHARDVAIVRARAQRAAVILGSATPAIETFHKALTGKFALSELTARAAGAALPAIEIVNLKQQANQSGIISEPLARALQDCVAGGGQAMLLLNRRGLAPCVQCGSCGAIIGCPNCSVSLTLHRNGNRMLCHYCGYARRLDQQCPHCRHVMLLPRGWGVQQLEAEVLRLLPGERVLRMDADSTVQRGAQLKMLETFNDGLARIMIGTQMIAKGHHFPRVTLVGIVNIDDLLGFPDFRAGERAYQLLHQMAGRAGRGEQPGRVIVQTRIPGHPVLEHLVRHDYRGFAEWELSQRRDGGYPPFVRLALLTAVSPREQDGAAAAAETARALASVAGIKVLGPVPAPLFRLRGQHRWHLLVKYHSTAELEQAAAVLPQLSGKAALGITVDPVALM